MLLFQTLHLKTQRGQSYTYETYLYVCNILFKYAHPWLSCKKPVMTVTRWFPVSAMHRDGTEPVFINRIHTYLFWPFKGGQLLDFRNRYFVLDNFFPSGHMDPFRRISICSIVVWWKSCTSHCTSFLPYLPIFPRRNCCVIWSLLLPVLGVYLMCFEIHCN